jgi:transcriptional regulator with PAS, ATPase and Fis domain
MASRNEEYQAFLGMPAVVVSEAMTQTLALAARIGRSSAAVLITGETGSGKEIVARAIHHFSLRCNQPWVDVNCAALPEHLIESELFGYDKGAFSGAGGPKPGLYELAHRGTLFLDEIGELEPRMQVKLLRVLDGVPYYRLGGTKKVTADVRIVAATNRNLDEAIAAGRFRRDLFHRLSQVAVSVPPLRERRADIIPLAEFFLGPVNPTAWFSDEAKRILTKHWWPGNVRELRNAVLQAATLAQDEEICAADLPPFAPQSPPLAEPPAVRSKKFQLHDIERETILGAIARVGGHQQKAADMLGISARTLTRKLKLYRSEPESDSESFEFPA